jgi:FkbM family methyltransferase
MKRFRETKEIIYRDQYRIREIKCPVDYIIDIGSHFGTFSLLSSVLFPKAKIISYEPSKDTFNILTENMGSFSNVKCVNMALGDNSPLNFEMEMYPTCTGNMFKKSANGYSVDTISLPGIFESNKIDVDNSRVILKIDCEGGERFLIDNKSVELMKKCHHICMEVHFPALNNNKFDEFPTWDEYDEWINENFKDKSILCYKSNKHKGLALYIITTKE